MAKKKATNGRAGTLQRITPATHSVYQTSRPHAWTIMIYLAGDNNLSDEMVWALKELYRVGTPEKVAVTVQFDAVAEGRTTRRYRVPTKADLLDLDGVFPILHDDVLPEVDSGDPDVLADFIQWSIETAPASHYMLVLSGHGGGVVGDFLTDTDRKPQLQPGSLTIPDMRQVFPRLRRSLDGAFFKERAERSVPTVIDVLGMDSCLMSMVEICSEVKGDVSFLVGSEGFQPNTGWPYFRLLQRLDELAARLPGPEALACQLVEMFTTYYSDFTQSDVSVDMAACDVGDGRMKNLQGAIGRFVTFYEEQIETPSGTWLDNAIVLAHWKAQSYKWEQYTDLWDFFHLLSQEGSAMPTKSASHYATTGEELEARCKSITDAIVDGKEAVVRCSDFAGPEFQHSNGLSVYFPWSRRFFFDEYRSTAFHIATRWGDFLDAHFARTQRRERDRRPPARPAGYKLIPNGPNHSMVVTSPNEISVRVSVPSSRVSVPSSRVSVPSSRVSVPSSRVSVPSSRFAQQLDSLVNDLSSSMKNPPTSFGDQVRFKAKDFAKVKRLKQWPEIEKLVFYSGEPGRKLVAALHKARHLP
jgi:Clostripain family